LFIRLKTVPSDQSEAVRLFEHVADKRHPFGEVKFGFCLHEGVGFDRNWFSSVKYFKSAVDRGDHACEFNFGLCCYTGEGISMNLTETVEYFRVSARATC
jgi:TPR repeat protein